MTELIVIGLFPKLVFQNFTIYQTQHQKLTKRFSFRPKLSVQTNSPGSHIYSDTTTKAMYSKFRVTSTPQLCVYYKIHKAFQFLACIFRFVCFHLSKTKSVFLLFPI